MTTDAIVPLAEQYTARYREEGLAHVRKLHLDQYGGNDGAALKQLRLDGSPFRLRDYHLSNSLVDSR